MGTRTITLTDLAAPAVLYIDLERRPRPEKVQPPTPLSQTQPVPLKQQVEAIVVQLIETGIYSEAEVTEMQSEAFLNVFADVSTDVMRKKAANSLAVLVAQLIHPKIHLDLQNLDALLDCEEDIEQLLTPLLPEGVSAKDYIQSRAHALSRQRAIAGKVQAVHQIDKLEKQALLQEAQADNQSLREWFQGIQVRLAQLNDRQKNMTAAMQHTLDTLNLEMVDLTKQQSINLKETYHVVHLQKVQRDRILGLLTQFEGF